jgi:hypothetical protein
LEEEEEEEAPKRVESKRVEDGSVKICLGYELVDGEAAGAEHSLMLCKRLARDCCRLFQLRFCPGNLRNYALTTVNVYMYLTPNGLQLKSHTIIAVASELVFELRLPDLANAVK